MALLEESIMDPFNYMQSMMIIIPLIFIGVIITIVIIVLYKYGTQEGWFTKRKYGKIEIKDKSFSEIKLQKEEAERKRKEAEKASKTPAKDKDK